MVNENRRDAVIGIEPALSTVDSAPMGVGNPWVPPPISASGSQTDAVGEGRADPEGRHHDPGTADAVWPVRLRGENVS